MNDVRQVPQISAQRRAQALIKLANDHDPMMALNVMSAYQMHYADLGETEFMSILSEDAAQYAERLDGWQSDGTPELSDQEILQLLWATLLLDRTEDAPDLIAEYQRRNPGDETFSKIVATLAGANVGRLRGVVSEEKYLPYALLNVGRTMFRNDDVDAALNFYNCLLDNEPWDVQVLYFRAQAHLALGQPDKAFADLKKLFDCFVESGFGCVVLVDDQPLSYYAYTLIGHADAVVRAVERKFFDEGFTSTSTVSVQAYRSDKTIMIYVLD